MATSQLAELIALTGAPLLDDGTAIRIAGDFRSGLGGITLDSSEWDAEVARRCYRMTLARNRVAIEVHRKMREGLHHLTARNLASSCNTSPATAWRALRDLERAGLVHIIRPQRPLHGQSCPVRSGGGHCTCHNPASRVYGRLPETSTVPERVRLMSSLFAHLRQSTDLTVAEVRKWIKEGRWSLIRAAWEAVKRSAASVRQFVQKSMVSLLTHSVKQGQATPKGMSEVLVRSVAPIRSDRTNTCAQPVDNGVGTTPDNRAGVIVDTDPVQHPVTTAPHAVVRPAGRIAQDGEVVGRDGMAVEVVKSVNAGAIFVEAARQKGWNPVSSDIKRVGRMARESRQDNRLEKHIAETARRLGERNLGPGMFNRVLADVERGLTGPTRNLTKFEQSMAYLRDLHARLSDGEELFPPTPRI